GRQPVGYRNRAQRTVAPHWLWADELYLLRRDASRAAVIAARVIPRLVADLPRRRFDRNVLSYAGRQQIRIAFVRAPFVSHPADPTGAVTDQQARLEASFRARVGCVRRQFEILYGSSGLSVGKSDGFGTLR